MADTDIDAQPPHKPVTALPTKVHNSATAIAVMDDSWPHNVTDWNEQWRLLDSAVPDIMSIRHPHEPETISQYHREDLWRRTFRGNEQAYMALRQMLKPSFPESRFPFTVGLAVLFSTMAILSAATTLWLGDNRLGTIISSTPLMAFPFYIFTINRRKAFRKRLNQYGNLVYDNPTCLGRMHSHILKAESKGILLSDELKAMLEVFKSLDSKATLSNTSVIPHSSVARLSVADCLAMTTLAGNMEHAVNVMQAGSELEIGGENSELLHRVAASLGHENLSEMVNYIKNPSKMVL